MMSGLSRLLGLTLLFCLGLPFALFALFTTTLALSTLFLRLLFVYLDLFLALLNGAISSTPPTPSPTPPHRTRHTRRKRSSSPTPTMHKASSFASLVGSGKDRDFEGVGGWRVAESADDEAVWMGMNRNLELPASPAAARKHRRSFTAGAQSPLLSRGLARTSGSASPEGYFSIKIEGRDGARE